MITVDGVSYRYGQRVALDGIRFEIARSRFCALLGPNGAGKSTLFALLTRLFVPSSGRILVSGFDVARQPRRALACLGVVFQQSTLDLDLTVRRNLAYFAALHGLAGAASMRAIDAALDRLSMRDYTGERVRSLSGGLRRRTEIARALVHAPPILLLDEPTTGLDARSRASITAQIHALCADRLTVLWATHLIDEVRPDDDVVVLDRGRVLLRDRADAVLRDASLRQLVPALSAETS